MSTASPLFRTVLVPLDGSPLAEEALPLALRIADKSGGSIRLALVHEPPAIPYDAPNARLVTSAEKAVEQAEREYLRKMETRLREGGTQVSTVGPLLGEIGPVLAEQVLELGADLVVMATHGRGGVQRVWLGSVADYLIRHVDVPVLLVRPGAGSTPATVASSATEILVPVDGSDLAEEALEPAAELARLWNLDLSLVRVLRPVMMITEPALPVPSSYDEELTKACRSQAQDYVDDIVDDLRADGLRASGTAVIGWNPIDTILELARPERVAVIAIATHGRGGLRRLALGSVADKLVRASAMPVLVYRPSSRRLTERRAAEEPVAAAR
jgi:nucleotide-binding universal stress UspA family protein